MIVAILGVISAIAIFSFDRIHRDAAVDARDRRNAQQMVSLFQGGEAAGIKFLVAGDLEATVDKIIGGETATSGVFDGATFSIGELGEAEKQAAIKYLELSGGVLSYNPDF